MLIGTTCCFYAENYKYIKDMVNDHQQSPQSHYSPLITAIMLTINVRDPCIEPTAFVETWLTNRV